MTTVAFEKRSAPIAFDKALGLCFGWFAFSKKNGEPYVDAHGDHFPEDEFVKAVDGLMAKPASEREINVGHAGGARGVICSAYAVTEDIAKAHGWDTGGNYGIVGSFRPDAELLKSIQAGDMFCLSIEGTASDVQEIAKSAVGAIAKAEHKRTMRGVDLTKLAVCKLGAHEGAAVAIIKSATDAARKLVALEVAKRQHALTDIVDGHQHVIYDIDDPDLRVGGTSYETASTGGYGHSHSWIRNADGSIEIAAGNGHRHTPATATTEIAMSLAPDLAKQLADAQALIAKTAARVATATNLTADQAAFAKRLKGADLDAFLDAPDAERVAKSTPIHKSERTGRLFFQGDDALVELAKDADATHAELAKSRESAGAAIIAKSAAAIPHVKGRELLAKAVHGVALTAEERATALADLATVDATIAKVCQPIGSGGGGDNASDPQIALEKATDAFAKEKGIDGAAAVVAFAKTDEGKRLYAAAYPATR